MTPSMQHLGIVSWRYEPFGVFMYEKNLMRMRKNLVYHAAMNILNVTGGAGKLIVRRKYEALWKRLKILWCCDAS